MSRSGYSEDLDGFELGRWRASVERAIQGKRGQTFLREMLAAFDAMTEKTLIANKLVTDTGEVCAMGAVCKARGLDVRAVDPECSETVAATVGLAEAMVREIAYENDDGFCGPWREEETPEHRWQRMHDWATKQLRAPGAAAREKETG